MTTRGLSTIIAITICMALSVQVSADLFTVNSAADPLASDPLNCAAGSTDCTLRDALAAADATPLMDTIVFAVDETIYLQKALTANTPVAIDGGGDTVLRVHQGYSIATLPDRPVFGGGDVQVLQPAYYSINSPRRAMLSLAGAGSVVQGLALDGSITPDPADLGLARIDFDSDGNTDFLLFTVDSGGPGMSERWAIAGGIDVTGNATISGNEISYLHGNGINVDSAQFTVVSDNVLTGGAAGEPGYASDGVNFYGSVFSSVSGNTVTGFRSGVSFVFSSGIDVDGNELTGNVQGVVLDTLDTTFGPIVVENNETSGNLANGIFVRQALGPQIAQNVIEGNGQVGIHIKGAGQIDIADNQVNGNGAGALEHGGILINEGSGAVSVVSNEVSNNTGFGVVIAESFGNVLSDNEITDNAGAGLVLLNGAQFNQVEFNQVKWNALGVIAGLDGDANFPSNNTYQGNELRQNAIADALDFDPACNDLWAGNTIDVAFSVAAGCIDQ